MVLVPSLLCCLKLAGWDWGVLGDWNEFYSLSSSLKYLNWSSSSKSLAEEPLLTVCVHKSGLCERALPHNILLCKRPPVANVLVLSVEIQQQKLEQRVL